MTRQQQVRRELAVVEQRDGDCVTVGSSSRRGGRVGLTRLDSDAMDVWHGCSLDVTR